MLVQNQSIAMSKISDNEQKDVDSEISKLKAEIKQLASQIKTARENQQVGEHQLQDQVLKTYPNLIDLPQAQAQQVSRIRATKTVEHWGKIFDLAWSSDSEYFVTASQDGRVTMCNAATGRRQLNIALKSCRVMTCDINSNSSCIASGGLDNICSIFSIDDQAIHEVM